GPTWCSPELKAVSVGPTHYDPSAPTVVGKTGVSFQSLSSFAETLGSSCSEGIGYSLGVGSSHASATWYYWNGSAWTTANGSVTQSNSSTEISTHAGNFHSAAGSGTVYFKAYLKSDGSTGCA